jgi:ribose 5-phosphate isomerase B
MLYIASDHGGYHLKKYLVRFVEKQLKREIVDLGPVEYDKNDDFPDYAFPLAKKVAGNKENLGILICKSGQGVCITANKVPGVRAMLGYSIESAEWGRKHDHANVLCLAGAVLSEEHATAIAKMFVETGENLDEKYTRRLKKIEDFENK